MYAINNHSRYNQSLAIRRATPIVFSCRNEKRTFPDKTRHVPTKHALKMPMNAIRFVVIACIVLVCSFIWMFYSLATTTDHQLDNPKSEYIAYYQTSGRNSLAIRTVLSLFHRVYPSARISMYFDSLGTTIKHVPLSNQDMVTFAGGVADSSASRTGMYFDSVHAAEGYLKRLQKTAGLLPDGWVFLLEDDVWVLQAVPPEDLLYDISGTCWASYRPEYTAVIWNHSKRQQTCYGGYGGHLVNSSRLLGLSSASVHQLITDLLAAHSPIASDELLSAVVLVDGGTIGYYAGYYEKLQGVGHFKTQHQMKWLYSW